MKKLITIIISLTFCLSMGSLFGQTYPGVFKGMEPKDFFEAVYSISKEAIMKYGPEFYRNELEPDISGRTYTGTGSVKPPSKMIVTYFYNPEQERMEEYFAARVIIDTDTGKATDLVLGNGMVYEGLDKQPDPVAPMKMEPSWRKGQRYSELSVEEQWRESELWGASSLEQEEQSKADVVSRVKHQKYLKAREARLDSIARAYDRQQQEETEHRTE